jgi:hypothetical protein
MPGIPGSITDKGFTFLRYGQPNDIFTEENEPSAPPYEQRIIKFLFYNPTLAFNDYKLLHSTGRGEMSNPNWESVLYRNTNQEPNDGRDDFTTPNARNGFGRNAKRFFNDL